MTTFGTERLDLVVLDAETLDAWVRRDAEALSARTGATFPAPPKAPPLFDEDLAALRDAISEASTRDQHAIWLIVERESRLPVGVVGVSAGQSPTTVTVGYSVYPDQQGQGFATEALRGLIARLFSKPDLAMVQATIPPWNAPSIRVAEKLGMQASGTAQDPEVGEVVVYRLMKTSPGE
jgi:RimJ/RimL family protein N-acetyltransferase